jgi:ATP-dependent DNA helicase RecQ
MDKYDVLRQYFGYDSFREGQETLIDAILSGRDVLGVMPTGAGKSLIYQVPAMVMDGLTLVISPLISLMKDQVAALNAEGIPAAYVTSAQTPEEMNTALASAAEGSVKLLYVSPERLENARFLAMAGLVPIALVAVDEAHCISQWG